jgi:hypothetical protein
MARQSGPVVQDLVMKDLDAGSKLSSYARQSGPTLSLLQYIGKIDQVT